MKLAFSCMSCVFASWKYAGVYGLNGFINRVNISINIHHKRTATKLCSHRDISKYVRIEYRFKLGKLPNDLTR